MSLLSDVSIIKQIEVDKTHIENFPLESEKGTKKLRAKFHRNAVSERNSYVEKQMNIFNYFSRRVYFELDSRITKLLPINNDLMFDEMAKDIDKYENLVIEINDKLSVSVKMNLEILLSSITDTISLEQLNTKIRTFIDNFKEANIVLTSDDFSYSMFTKTYMDMYFENIDKYDFKDIASVCFQKVYFECPKIIMHIKMCLRSIINKYDAQLVKYMDEKTKKELEEENVEKKQVIPEYLRNKTEYMWSLKKDPYRNLDKFLSKKESIADYLIDSPTRESKFSTFAIGGSYSSLDEEAEAKFDMVIRDFYGVLGELREFYRYEVILKDLIKRYKEKESSKATFDQKSKEVAESEKVRQKLLKDYLNSGKPKLFGFLGKDLTKVSKLHINEELVKLNQLYVELDNAAFNNKIATILDDAASIYDIFETSLLSFSYIEKKFIETFGEEDDFDLEKEFKRYIKFLFSSFNDFLRKVNGLVDYDITKIVADKYKILGLNIDVENISRDNIGSTKEVLEFVINSLCIEENDLNSEMINYICKIKEIKPLEGWEIVNEEII